VHTLTYTDEGQTATITEANKTLTIGYGPDGDRFKTDYSVGGANQYTRYYFDTYEKEFKYGVLQKQLNYIYAGGQLIAIFEQNSGSGNKLHYVYTDRQGSLKVITSATGAIEQRLSYDAWGVRRNYATGLPLTDTELSAATTLTSRGYTGQEHIDGMGLINMNARFYEPGLGVFLSPDNYVQDPLSSQNFNRYAYCINNPLKYTDPTGEFFLGTVLTFVGDLLKTTFIDGGLDPTSKSARQNAWKDFDPTAQWSPTNKARKIDIGGFKTDPNRNFWGRSWQLISRWTWELPQTVLGKTISHVRNMTGNVDDVSYYGGATLVNKNDPSSEEWGFTLGPYINSNMMKADPYRDPVFRHEFGHTLQSRLVGPLYLTSVALPSLVGGFLDYNLGINNHDREWYESQSNRMSERYFSNHDTGALIALPWDNNVYPRDYNPSLYWIVAHPAPAFLWWLFF